MKKLFFLFGFVLFMSGSSFAQTWYVQDDAIDALKEAMVELNVPVQANVNDTNSTATLQGAKFLAVRLLLNLVPEQGNNQSTLNSVLQHDRILQYNLGSAKKAELNDYLLSILTKS